MSEDNDRMPGRSARSMIISPRSRRQELRVGKLVMVLDETQRNPILVTEPAFLELPARRAKWDREDKR